MVRDGLHNSLRESEQAIATIHAKGDLQNSRSFKAASDSPSLKARIQVLRSHSQALTARRAVEDQLRKLGERSGFDFMLVSATDGSPLAGVIRQTVTGKDSPGQLEPSDIALLYHSDSGFRVLGGRIFQIVSIPIDQNDENIGVLSVGKYFDVSDFTTPVVIVHWGEVIESNIPQAPLDELTRALVHCTDHSECDVRLQGSNWISVPLQSFSGGYVLLSLENVDKATAPIQSRLSSLFVTSLMLSVLIAFLCSVGSSNNIVKPIEAVVSHLRIAVRTGVLSELKSQSSSILEIRELADFYNQAAISVRAANESLEAAYLEFVGSLANALDARDPYTAGHSWRVSQHSCAIASAMGLDPSDIERIRIGALLHDIGKIGIADSLLQKRGKLTDKQAELVKQHPVIGRKILQGVQGFAPFLAAVELHHENWDGSGYPHGFAGEESPIDARIIHVADAYDAMTTHRPYRRGLTDDEAIAELLEFAGLQFDPQIVEVFVCLPRQVVAPNIAAGDTANHLDDRLIWSSAMRSSANGRDD
jgi:HD-GYP domain-containing protein (c-di-GMP phosphodiesterase class II)